MMDYRDIPEWWAMCCNSQCERADQCLRQQACRQMPEELRRWTCVLPHVWKDGDCPSFQPYEKVTMARGLAAIYDNVHNRQARADIRSHLTAHFGSKGTYYRYKDKLRNINPQMQQDIRDIVHHYAPGVEVNFDETYEGYDFTVV